MKKLLLSLLILLSLTPQQLFAAEQPQVIPVYDEYGRQVALEPDAFLLNGTTILPLRDLAEYLGVTVTWRPTGDVTLTRGQSLIKLQAGETTAYIQDADRTDTVQMSAAPVYIAQTLYVPLRFISEAFGLPVYYRVYAEENCFEPAVFLGNSQYADTFPTGYSSDSLYTRLQQKDHSPTVTDTLRQELANSYYPLQDLITIISLYVNDPLIKCVENREADQAAYYIDEALQQSSEWQDFLDLARPIHSDYSFEVLQVTADEDRIKATLATSSFTVLYDIPLLIEIELEKQPTTWFTASPDADRHSIYAELGGWKLTSLKNPRVYVSLQALRDNEPAMHDRWLAIRILTNELPE